MGPIERLLPPDGSGDGSGDVAAAELFGSTQDFLPLADALSDAERNALGRAAGRRRADYAAARACARTAFTRLGVPPAPVLMRPDRSPLWPDGLVGSLTHTSGYAAAAVARAECCPAIGIDAEPDAPLPDGVGNRVLLPADVAALDGLPAGPAWDRLVFCVKEATFKVWHPLMGGWLGFDDATVRIGADGTCSATLLGAPLVASGRALSTITGRWSATAGLLGCVLTAAA